MHYSVVNYPNIFLIGNCHWKYIHVDIYTVEMPSKLGESQDETMHKPQTRSV